MINVSRKLAAAGSVPVGASGSQSHGRRGHGVMNSVRRVLQRIDRSAQGYLAALAEARNHDYWSCSCDWQH
ncbi:MAG: hypothetical protein WCY98_04660 [Castellaniella sp.]